MNSFSLRVEMWYKQPVSQVIGDSGDIPHIVAQGERLGNVPHVLFLSFSQSANMHGSQWPCDLWQRHETSNNPYPLVLWNSLKVLLCRTHSTNKYEGRMSTSPTVYKVEIRFVFVREICPRSCEEWMGCEYVNMDGIPDFFRSRVKE